MLRSSSTLQKPLTLSPALLYTETSHGLASYFSLGVPSLGLLLCWHKELLDFFEIFQCRIWSEVSLCKWPHGATAKCAITFKPKSTETTAVVLRCPTSALNLSIFVGPVRLIYLQTWTVALNNAGCIWQPFALWKMSECWCYFEIE